MNIIEEYINQTFGDKIPIFSRIIYTPSVVSGANSVVAIDHAQQGAIGIIIHTIDLTVPVGAGVAVITDNNGKIVRQFNRIQEASGNFVFPYVLPGSYLKFTCSTNDVNFVLGYQYVSATDSTKKKNVSNS